MAQREAENKEQDAAEAAFGALCAWQCSQCRAALRPDREFTCCGRAHCPFCGQVWCEHRVASLTWGQFTVKDIVMRALPGLVPGTLQTVKTWTSDERTAVFGAAAPYLEDFFGTGLTETACSINAAKLVLIDAVMRAEKHVRFRLPCRHYHQAWFCREGGAATERAAAVVRDLRVGLKEFRRLTSKTHVLKGHANR